MASRKVRASGVDEAVPVGTLPASWLCWPTSPEASSNPRPKRAGKRVAILVIEMSQQLAGFVEIKTGIARGQLGGVAVA